jgi:ATP-dependent DNA helicase RecQ
MAGPAVPPRAAELSIPKPRGEKPAKSAIPVDADLLEFLREWRRRVSLRENMPAFVVLHDTSLEDLCRKLPRNRSELLGVSGIGEKKAHIYGAEILSVLEAFRNGARAEARQEERVSPAEETMRLLGEGRTFQEIANIRERRLNTVIDLVAELVERGRLAFDDRWVAPATRAQIEDAAKRSGTARMKTIKDALPEEISYGEIRLVLAARARTGSSEQASRPPLVN